jgi:hypothetical protein
MKKVKVTATMYYRERARTRLLKIIHNGCNSRVNNLCNAVINSAIKYRRYSMGVGGGTKKGRTEKSRTGLRNGDVPVLAIIPFKN